MKEQTGNVPINKWAKEDRPREKMLLKGASALSDAELIAILISSGSSSESAVQLSQRILRSTQDNLGALAKLTISELQANFKGIGIAKAVSITAALELGKRRGVSEVIQKERIGSSRDAFLLFHVRLCDLPYEELWVALVNRAHKVIETLKISQGGTDSTVADLRLILKPAINALAHGIILCHNHPSGNLQPSTHDDQLTQRLQKAAQLIDIVLLDHIILSDNLYYSYADEGRLRI